MCQLVQTDEPENFSSRMVVTPQELKEQLEEAEAAAAAWEGREAAADARAAALSDTVQVAR